jgi:hypothetical protein
MDLKRHIGISFQREGIHCYPAALTDPKLKDVSYLGHPHRHMFHFYVRLEVFHNDRDVEFILFKHWLEDLYEQGADYQSCEMLAEGLINLVNAQFPGRDITVKVFEDDENGAVLEYHMDRTN